jgi:hypothetical protein
VDFCKRTDHADARARHDGGAALDALPIDLYSVGNSAEFFAAIPGAVVGIPDAAKGGTPAQGALDA